MATSSIEAPTMPLSIGAPDTNRGLRAQLYRVPFPGWAAAWTNRTTTIAGYNDVICFAETPTRIYFGLGVGVANTQTFRSLLKTTWAATIHTTPISIIGPRVICAVNPDLLLLGTIDPANAKVYKYVPSTGVFTNLVFPSSATSDQIAAFRPSALNPDVVYVGSGATVTSGLAEVWKLTLSTAAWLKIGAGGGLGGWTQSINSVAIPAIVEEPSGALTVMVAGGAANFLEVWQTDAALTNWAKIAGGAAGTNSSWVTGTKRTGRIIRHNGTLYAGLGGSTAGDAELWKLPPGGAWSKIGGDGAGWTGKTRCQNMAALGKFLVLGFDGAGAGDAEVWQMNLQTGVIAQIGGDGIRSSWTTQLRANTLMIAANRALWAGIGSGSTGTAAGWQLKEA